MTDPLVVAPAVTVTREPSLLVRTVALAAGAALLALGTAISVGFALVGPVAILAVAAILRAKRRALVPVASWAVATGSLLVALLIAGGVAAKSMPQGTWKDIQRRADSVSATQRPAPPPAWLEKFAPGSAQRAATQRPPRLTPGLMIFGAVVAAAMFSGFLGTLGWGSAMLIGYFFLRRWPGTTAPRLT